MILDSGDTECDLCRGRSRYAYSGFGPVCAKLECKWWGGDSICLLAVDREITLLEPEAGGSLRRLPEDVCPLECPDC
jgi:hypothetical protein